MIHEVDSALRTLIEREAGGVRDVEIVFDAPTREWAGRRNSPTIDVYLYDIREDLRRRERGMHNVYDDHNVVVSRHLPPRHFKLSYLITAWTQRPEDEHRLLSSLLSCFVRYEALPRDVLTGPLNDLGLPIPITIALPPPEDRAFADVWSALGGELKPSIDLVVVTPLDTGQQFHTGPPVEQPPRISLGGSGGWPTRETKSRDGVESWPDGTEPDGLVAAGGARSGIEGTGRARDGDATPEGGPAKGGTSGSGSGGRRRTTRTTRGSGSGASGAGSSGSGSSGSGSSGGDASGAATDSWTQATGWAAAMAPAGSAEVTGPIAGRAAGRPAAGLHRTGSAADEAASDAPVEGATSSTGKGAGVPTGKGTGGRPGPRVAMTRVRQTKKRT